MSYREPAQKHVDVYEWDIVLAHGAVRVVGLSTEHLDNCRYQTWGAPCGCRDGKPRVSSPVVCANTRRVLKEIWFSGDPTTGEGRHLLDVGPGSTIPVMSGKSYRLVGERKVEGHQGFASGSIFRVYPEEDRAKAEEEARSGMGWLARLFQALLPWREERST